MFGLATVLKMLNLTQIMHWQKTSVRA